MVKNKQGRRTPFADAFSFRGHSPSRIGCIGSWDRWEHVETLELGHLVLPHRVCCTLSNTPPAPSAQGGIAPA